jgi:hypothetical protein
LSTPVRRTNKPQVIKISTFSKTSSIIKMAWSFWRFNFQAKRE